MARTEGCVGQGSHTWSESHTTSFFETIASRLQRSLVVQIALKSPFGTCSSHNYNTRRCAHSDSTVFISVLALCLGYIAVPVSGQTETVLVSNWSQSVNATSMVDDERLQTFTTGSHAEGYVLTRIELDFILKSTPDSFTVHLWTSSGNRPGNRIAVLETTEVVVGKPTEFASSSPIVLEPDSHYFLHLAVKNPNDVLILRATKSGAEDRPPEPKSWQIADNSIHIPSFGSTAWNMEESVMKIRIFGYERGIAQAGPS